MLPLAVLLGLHFIIVLTFMASKLWGDHTFGGTYVSRWVYSFGVPNSSGFMFPCENFHMCVGLRFGLFFWLMMGLGFGPQYKLEASLKEHLKCGLLPSLLVMF